MTSELYPESLGFRKGPIGSHSSRTMMLAELSALLSCCEPEANWPDFLEAIVAQNILGKSTTSVRKSTAQKLRELYALDRSVPVFRMLRRVWDLDPEGQALSALLVAMARDPLLRCTAEPVLSLSEGAMLDRGRVTRAVTDLVGERQNENTRDKVVRNASSSWTQSGHLEGRTFKRRRRVRATTGPLIMALFLGYLQGRRGPGVIDTFWTRVLDCPVDRVKNMASTASLSGLIRFRSAGDVLDIGFPDMLSQAEQERLHESD
ncbi:MAG: hypothetical protein JJU29_07510 [Verrucomicrobia bacterium]|nr:hypothetical protein [Verrucomicrobiota bacterium]MCH8511651.1 hypothetical protein [Kiritimatiellia bacterium]